MNNSKQFHVYLCKISIEILSSMLNYMRYVPMTIFDPNLCSFKFLPHSFRMIPNLWLPPEKMWAKTVGKLDSLFRPCEQYGASWPPPPTST